MFCQQYFAYLIEFCAQTFELYAIQDLIEIAIFIYITYKCLLWLKQDHTKNLLIGSYSYMAILIAAHFCSCNILFSTLLLATPICIIFALIIHQKQLQKNFILSSKIKATLAATPQKNWLESLIQSCLIAAHQQKNIVCIVERSQHLSPLLQTPFILQVPIQQDITNFILSSSKISDSCLLWIHESGTIYSINVAWGDVLLNELILKPRNAQSLLQEAALLLTEKTDALVFSIHTTSDTHTIWYKGSCIKQTTVQHMLQFIAKILKTPTASSVVLKKGNDHDQSNTFTP